MRHSPLCNNITGVALILLSLVPTRESQQNGKPERRLAQPVPSVHEVQRKRAGQPSYNSWRARRKLASGEGGTKKSQPGG